MKKPRNKKIYASLILSTGYDQEEALKRLVLGIFGFGTILGDKIQTTVFDPESEEHGLMLTNDKMLSGWLAVDNANREMVDLDMIEKMVNETISKLKMQAEDLKDELTSQIEKESKKKNVIN